MEIFIVSMEDGGCPEKWIMGVYPTEALAVARVKQLEADEMAEFVWYDCAVMGPNGVDTRFCNR